MKKQWQIFLTAVMFLTRIRVPSNIDHHSSYLQRAAAYFPLVGILVGSISIFFYFLLALFFSGDIAILGAMIASILTTGAFHEDGFADVCDGFGGGWTKEKILTIMKDSRLGTYGVTGLLFMLASKFLLLKMLADALVPLAFPINYKVFEYKNFIGICLLAHTFSRYMSVTVIQQYSYVGDAETGKSKPLATQPLSFIELLLAAALALSPFVVLPLLFLWILIPAIITRFYLAAYFKKWIGGYTGDCLGAIQQVTEIIIYLSAHILWKYF